MDGHRLEGSGAAPLVATRSYAFERGVTAAGEGRLAIPTTPELRGEQAVFVARTISSLAARARAGGAGEWIFDDAAELERTWAALVAAVQTPVARVPTAQAQREVSREAAGAAASGLTRRFLELVGALVGAEEPFVCVDSKLEYGDYDQCTRSELWRSGAVEVRVAGEGITSGHGVHGEDGSLTMTSPASEGRDAYAHARIDMRYGGSVSVTVRGVLDAQALADRFVAPG